MSSLRRVDLAIMRGGTSRGPVLGSDDAPPVGASRDAFARSLVGGQSADGLGGSTANTNKIVLVGQPVRGNAVDLDYIVGSVATAGDTVDWSGTCGNMTAAVVPYGAMSGLLCTERRDGRFCLRNLATGGLVDVTVDHPEQLASPGAESLLTTSYRNPGGAVLGTTLPTGRARDALSVDGEDIDATVIDVTHPYLLLRYEQVAGDRRIQDPDTAAHIELIRATCCQQLGLCTDPAEARHHFAAIPRVLLVHSAPEAGVDVRITAISMGDAIDTVPVSAAMSLAAARQIEGTLVSDGPSRKGEEAICVAGPNAAIRASALVDATGHVVSAAVDRTARCLAWGSAWV